MANKQEYPARAEVSLDESQLEDVPQPPRPIGIPSTAVWEYIFELGRWAWADPVDLGLADCFDLTQSSGYDADISDNDFDPDAVEQPERPLGVPLFAVWEYIPEIGGWAWANPVEPGEQYDLVYCEPYFDYDEPQFTAIRPR